jgi:hypothetical protein
MEYLTMVTVEQRASSEYAVEFQLEVAQEVDQLQLLHPWRKQLLFGSH